jgi:hypothetical protein
VPLIALLVWIVVIGLLVALIQRYAPIDQAFKTLALVVGIIVAIWLALSAFGMLPHSITVPKVQ